MYREIHIKMPVETEILGRMLKFSVLSESMQREVAAEIEKIEIRYRKQQRRRENA